MRHIEAKTILPEENHPFLGARETLNGNNRRRERENPIFPVFISTSQENLTKKTNLTGVKTLGEKRIKVGITSKGSMGVVGFLNLAYISVATVQSSFEQVLRKHYEVVYFNQRSEIGEEEKLAYANLLMNSDIVLASVNRDNALLYEIREELESKTPIAFLALGSMPEGGMFIRSRAPFFRKGDSILVSCTADGEIFKRLVERTDASVYVLPFGIDCQIFKPLPEDCNRMARLSMGVGVDTPLLLYSGRIHPEKGLHILIWMLEEIVQRNDKVVLCIAGPIENERFPHFNVPTDGYYSYLRELIVSRKLGHHVLFVGNQPQKSLAALYSTADVLIHPTISPTENFGYTPVEAMACGTPVVCSHLGGMKDTVVDGETGFFMSSIVTPHGIKLDWKSGVQAVLRLLHDSDLREEIGQKGVLRVREHFSMERFEINLLSIIESMLQKSGENGKKRNGTVFTPKALELWDEKKQKENLSSDEERCPNVYPNPWSNISYKFMVEPYVSFKGDEIEARLSSIPRFTVPIKIFHEEQKLLVEDSIWPCAYEVEPWEIKVLEEIDSRKSLQNIGDTLFPEEELSIEKIISFVTELMQEGIAI